MEKELLDIAKAEGYDAAAKLVADISLRLLATQFDITIMQALNTISKELTDQKAKVLEIESVKTCKCNKLCNK